MRRQRQRGQRAELTFLLLLLCVAFVFVSCSFFLRDHPTIHHTSPHRTAPHLTAPHLTFTGPHDHSANEEVLTALSPPTARSQRRSSSGSEEKRIDIVFAV